MSPDDLDQSGYLLVLGELCLCGTLPVALSEVDRHKDIIQVLLDSSQTLMLASFQFLFLVVLAVALLGGVAAFRPATPVVARAALQTFARKTVSSGSETDSTKEISKAARDAEAAREDKKVSGLWFQ